MIDRIHFNICGPIQTKSLNGSKYFMTFIDDKSRKSIFYFLKHKSEAFNKFKIYKEFSEFFNGGIIKILQSDGVVNIFVMNLIYFVSNVELFNKLLTLTL